MTQSNTIGQIKKLFISDRDTKQRNIKESIYVDKNGILNDKFYNTEVDRSVLITSLHAYELMKEKDIDAKYGQLGENILVNFNPYDLQEGTQLLIGDSILEITIECTICNLLTKINNKVPKLLKKDRGVFAKVIQEGTIKIGDSVTLTN